MLELIDRGDRQVKLRGHRIELGEVEATLHACPGVRAGAVVVRDTPELGHHLVAYYVSDSDQDFIYAYLRGNLPAHLLPAAYVSLSELPRTPIGKLDTPALSAFDTSITKSVPHADQPEGRFAKLIAEVWTEVLGREHISTDDDFFALGGHSPVALRLVGRLRRTFDLELSVKDVYRHPRLLDLARHLEDLADTVGKA